jgi:hypothetical protein
MRRVPHVTARESLPTDLAAAHAMFLADRAARFGAKTGGKTRKQYSQCGPEFASGNFSGVLEGLRGRDSVLGWFACNTPCSV